MDYKYIYSDPKYKERLPDTEWYATDPSFYERLDLLDLTNSSRVLSLGCGSANFDEMLCKKYGIERQNYHLVDIMDLRKDAKDMHFSQVDLNFDPLPFGDGSHDAVFCMQTLEHIENPRHIIREARRVLRPGGTLILSIPNGWSIFSRLLFLFTGRIYRYHRPKTLHISFMPENLFRDATGNFDDTHPIWSSNYLFDELFLFLLHDYRGRLKWLSRIKIRLPRSKPFSSNVCFFLKKLI